MAKGGYRPGAGRIQHPINKLADQIMNAFPRAYQIAGEEKGLTGEPDKVVIETIAQILADEIRAGKGINVVVLHANFIGKVTGKGDGNGNKSALFDALSQCPGLLPDTQTALEGNVTEKTVTNTMVKAKRPTHSKCDGRENEVLEGFFNPQLALPLNEND